MSLEQVEFNTRWDGLRLAHAFRPGDRIHLCIVPETKGFGEGPFAGFWEINLYGDKDGKPDFGNYINGTVVRGGIDDLEEIADVFGGRLRNGVSPDEMFMDIEEQTRFSLRELARKFGLIR